MSYSQKRDRVSKINELGEELEETKYLAEAKEKLLMYHIDEMEEVYKALRVRVKELEKARKINEKIFFSTMETLTRTLEARDSYTRGHSHRVSEYTVALAKILNLDRDYIETLRLAASLHDLGKIGIKDVILNKKGSLTESEFSVIKLHPEIGAQILQPLENVKEMIPWIKYHHERYDGKGYPDGLRKNDIPLGAKIIAVADSYDAMTTDRPYRKALKAEIASKEIQDNLGLQFDPEIGKAWLEVFNKGVL